MLSKCYQNGKNSKKIAKRLSGKNPESLAIGGERGIRTLGAFYCSHDFQFGILIFEKN